MNKEKDLERQKHMVLAGNRHDITLFRRQIKIISFLNPRYIYGFNARSQMHLSHHSKFDYLGRIESFNTTSISMIILASNNLHLKETERLLHFQYLDLEGIKRVSMKDLPLYVSWPWVSAEFTEILKGAK